MVVAARVEPLRRGGVLGAEIVERRTDRHRDVQRVADGAAMAGEAAARRHQSHLHVGSRRPWLLDMATTTVAAGKIFKAMINGQPTIPAGLGDGFRRRPHHRTSRPR